MAEKWIRFEETKPKPKTKVWNVIATDGDILLGVISWFGRWRTYAFFPEPQTVFERTCLRDISDFIDEQNARQKASKDKQKAVVATTAQTR